MDIAEKLTQLWSTQSPVKIENIRWKENQGKLDLLIGNNTTFQTSDELIVYRKINDQTEDAYTSRYISISAIEEIDNNSQMISIIEYVSKTRMLMPVIAKGNRRVMKHQTTINDW